MNYKKITITSLPNQTVWWWFFEGITQLDADGDGDHDILVGMTGAIWDPKRATDPTPYVIENLGGDKFQIASKWASGNPEVAGWINNLVVGDYNEDGFNDVLVVDHGREDKPYEQRDFAQPILYLSSEKGWIQTSQTIQVTTNWTAPGKDFWHGSTNARDFNGDGYLDIVMTALGRAGLELWLGDGKGNFANNSATLLPSFIDRTTSKTTGGWTSFGISGFIDAGGDGKQDIFALPYGFTPDNANGYIVLSSGSSSSQYIDLGNLANHSAVINNANRGYSEALIYDFDGNGLEDIVAIAEASNGKAEGVMYLLYLSQDKPFVFNDKTVERFGSYSTAHPQLSTHSPAYPDVYVNGASTEFSMGDYNGDGFMDINLGFPFQGKWNALSTNIYVNDGKGKFSRTFEVTIDGEINAAVTLRSDGVGDLNGDGYSDIFLVENNYTSKKDEISLLLSNSSILSKTFTGTDQSESLRANNLNNQIQGNAGNDLIDGGAGVDTAIYLGSLNSFRLSQKTVGTTQVIDTITTRSGTDTLTNVERLKFTDTMLALDIGKDQTAGSGYMLYKAAFNRTPDVGGLGFWINKMDTGMSYSDVANNFVNSAEFKTAFGGSNPTVNTLVTKLYNNVLARAPDAGGLAFWQEKLTTGWSTADVLGYFSTSGENVTNVTPLIANGIQYQQFVG